MGNLLTKCCRPFLLRKLLGKPSVSVANYRPISLLNCNIKLYSKIIDTHLNDILPSLIDIDQMGFVKNYQTRDGSRRILDLIQITQAEPADSVLFSLDAFNQVSLVHFEICIWGLCIEGYYLLVLTYDSFCSCVCFWISFLLFSYP